MGDIVVLGSTEDQVIYRASAGAIRIRVNFPYSAKPHMGFYSKIPPHVELYKFYIGDIFKLIDVVENNVIDTYSEDPETCFVEFKDFWVSWHGGKFQYGMCSDYNTPMRSIKLENAQKIGYIRFDKPTIGDEAEIQWVIERPPVLLNRLQMKSDKKIEGGEIHWVKMTRKSVLPMNAVIGGHEGEPLYIARAWHNHSLIPGKYYRSRKEMYVAWGRRAHQKTECEVLCGYDCEWVKTKDNFIPQNAIIGGYSEVRNEPLYIGRAMVEGFMVIGKIHTLYHLCYLPFDNLEIEKSSFEVLVHKRPSRGFFHDPDYVPTFKQQ